MIFKIHLPIATQRAWGTQALKIVLLDYVAYGVDVQLLVNIIHPYTHEPFVNIHCAVDKTIGQVIQRETLHFPEDLEKYMKTWYMEDNEKSWPFIKDWVFEIDIPEGYHI
jgi:hypothetical protein